MAKAWKKIQRSDEDFTGKVTGTIDGTSVADIKTGASAGTAAKVITDDAFDGSKKLKVANAAEALKNANTTASDVNLGNVTNESKSTMFTAPTFSGTVSGVSKTHVGLSAVANEDPTTLKSTMSLNNVENKSQATILTGDLTGKVGGTTVATIKSGASAGSTANQDSTGTILGGNLTGSVDGTAVATVKSGAVAGATIAPAFDTTGSSPIIKVANAPSTLKNSGISISSGGVLSGAGGGTVTASGVGAIKTDASNAPSTLKNAQITLTASGGTVTLNNAGSGSIGKPDIGLGNVVNQAITVASGKIKFDGSAQTIDADKLGGKTVSEAESSASSAAQTAIIGGAPGALQTLDALAAALGDDASFATTTTNSIATKGKAPMTLTAEDVDGDSTFDNNPASEAIGQIGVFGGNQYVVVDI